MNNTGEQQIPPEAANAIIGLIGSTFAELKKIDDHNIGSTSYTRGIKSDFKKLIQDAQVAVSQQPPVAQFVPPPPAPPAFVPRLEPIPVTSPAISQPTGVVLEDNPDQLQFDFYKKITPEDINQKLTDINLNLNSIVEKLNKVLKILTDANKDKQ